VKKLLFTTAALAALGLAAPQAGAQEELSHNWLYMQRDDAGDYRVFGDDYPEGRQVLYEDGVRPQSCPEGAWFIEHDEQTGEFDQIRGCTTTETAFNVAPMTTASGEPFPEDTYLVTPRDD
jgi:hypothetical protein